MTRGVPNTPGSPKVEAAYLKGLAKGREAAEIDRGNEQTIAYWLDVMRWQATKELARARLGPTYRKNTAYLMGLARGYREVVR